MHWQQVEYKQPHELHARNMAVSAGAVGEEVDKLQRIVNSQSGPVTQQLVKETLDKIRNG